MPRDITEFFYLRAYPEGDGRWWIEFYRSDQVLFNSFMGPDVRTAVRTFWPNSRPRIDTVIERRPLSRRPLGDEGWYEARRKVDGTTLELRGPYATWEEVL